MAIDTSKLEAVLIQDEAFAVPGGEAPRPGAMRLVQALAAAGIRPLLFGGASAHAPLERISGGDADDPDALSAILRQSGLQPDALGLLAAKPAVAQAGRICGVAQIAVIGGEARDSDRIVVRDPAELAVKEGRLVLRTLQSVPDADPETVRALLRGRRPAVFLDYDGVLTPIVSDHTKTALHPSMRAALQALSAACPTAAVSGRDLADLRRLIGLEGMYYAGSHGFEIAAPDGSVWGERGLEFLPDLDAAEAELRTALSPISGHAVDRKRFSVAVHYRNVSDSDVSALTRAVDATITAHHRLAKGFGKKVYEVQPNIDWNKGRAVRWLIERGGLDDPEVLPIYIGDDITDETAFRALAGQGLGIVVRDSDPRPTAADLGVSDVAGVEALLRLLAAEAGIRK